MNRRIFLKKCIALAALTGSGWFLRPRFIRAEDQPPAQKLEIEKTDAEWKQILTSEQYNVLRLRGTEAPYSSPLEKEHRNGVFSCAGCDLPLFSSDSKFDSGTGWPSFTAPLPNAVATTVDRELLYPRTEVHCRRCGGHLGHVFDDGPPPTGKRYCMNGVSLKFTPQA